MGLLAAEITAFIIYIQPKLQQDPGDETVALLRMLIYNMNNTAFGGVAPAPVTWNGAPTLLSVAQIILYLSLDATLLCGLYALIVKFFTSSYALGWKNTFLDKLTRLMFFVIYLSLGSVFFGIAVALTLQIPVIPSIGAISVGALSKVHVAG